VSKTINEDHISTAEARNHFSEVINRAAYGKERIVLTRRGKDIVGVVPVEDVELLQRLEDQIDINLADAIKKEIEEGKPVIPLEKAAIAWGVE
jgi:prevent-host-death family protein